MNGSFNSTSPIASGINAAPAMKPRFTIIIPTIGRPKYFGPALASAAAQTYEPLDILVSDNAANPPIAPAEIANWAPRANVRLVRRPLRLAAPAHVNLCMREAGGDYVMILADDDLLAPRYVEAAMECVQKHSAVTVVVSMQTAIDEAFLGPLSAAPISFQLLSGREYVARTLADSSQGALTVTPMIARRTHLIEMGGMPDYPTGAGSDTMLFWRVALGGTVGLLESGYYYRIYPASTGLAMPWPDLVQAITMGEKDVLKLRDQGLMDASTFFRIVRGSTRLLVGRWLGIYRHRAGLRNKVRPLFDIAFLQLKMGWRYGPRALPLVQRLFRA